MQSLLEERLQKDIDQIRDKVIDMGEMAEQGLKMSLRALTEKNRQLAYSVILRDRNIDEAEKELDRLCQEFLVRQQPAGGHLRFVYAVIKINNELERVGDYAESIARQYLTVGSIEAGEFYDRIKEIANQSIPMLRNALKSFLDKDAQLAKQTMKMEKKADEIRYQIHEDLVKLRDDGTIASEALPPLMIIASRFERVADQAQNICEEVLFMCTGENIKHEGQDVTRVLFVDEGDACRGQMAEGIGNSLGLDRFMFSSAGIAPRPIDPRTVAFMRDKGIDISNQKSQYLNEILNLGSYEVIVSLCREAEQAFPPPPTKTVSISWSIEDPSKLNGPEEKILAAYEKTYNYINEHIRDLVEAILGDDIKQEEVNHVQVS
ncbi:phosphate signaling complex protein PhoU [bacterium]|nr:phosphate signaling complex protein PhoU [bacterium]